MKKCGIYKIISPSNKVYVGQSIDIETRLSKYKGLHCKNQSYLYNSLKKHGWEKHKFEIICQCDIPDLDNLEKYYIELFQTFNHEHGLNLKAGGNGGGLSSEITKIKLSESHKNKKAWNKGKKMSSEQYKKCENTMFKKGNVGIRKGVELTEEHKLKLSKAHKGKRLSEEHKRKISEKMKISMLGNKNRCK